MQIGYHIIKQDVFEGNKNKFMQGMLKWRLHVPN